MFPKELVIEPTNICNANCVFCAYQHQSEFRMGRGVMSSEVLKDVLQQFSDLKGETVNFTPLVGEALLDPKILEKIEIAKSMGFRVYLYSNGINLYKLDLNRLLDTGLDQILLSVAPFDKGDHEMIYRSGKYSRLVDGLTRLLSLRNERGSALEVVLSFRSHVPMKELLRKLDFREQIWPKMRPEERSKIGALVRNFDNWGGLIRQSDLVGEMRLAIPPRLKFRPCEWSFILMVMYDGKVRACSCRFAGVEVEEADGLLVGDIAESTLEQIWSGPEIRELRRRFLRGDLPAVCRSCAMYRSV